MLNISQVAFSIAGFDIYWYGITMALGICLGTALGIIREKKYGFAQDSVLNMMLFAVPVSLICARLYYVVFSWDQFRGNLLSILDLRGGGLAFYGSIIGGVGTGFVYTKIHHNSFMDMCDVAAPGIALGQAIGRWGNFFNQEAFGYTVTNPSLCWFPFSVYIQSDASWHLATFFYESIWTLGICVFLLLLERSRKTREKGTLFFLYVLLYSFERGIVEGMRTDSLMWGSFRVSQILSFLVFALSAVILLVRKSRKNRKSREVLERKQQSNETSTAHTPEKP